jgi:hypothetical protein
MCEISRHPPLSDNTPIIPALLPTRRLHQESLLPIGASIGHLEAPHIVTGIHGPHSHRAPQAFDDPAAQSFVVCAVQGYGVIAHIVVR